LGTLTVLFAGRIAEELCCGDISAGASNDIERASDLARRMVCEWGMSDELGPINYANEESPTFLGAGVAKARAHSEATAIVIDKEVKTIVDTCYKRAEKLLSKNRPQLEAIAKALLKWETLSARDCEQVARGEEPDCAKERTSGVAARPEPVVVRPEFKPIEGIGGGVAPLGV
ncbi:MAG TPA: cell division protein FtsH, partial [Planctomycetota bacterium]|nr:cell division protein FtsH [Planctomycetota bacterium]